MRFLFPALCLALVSSATPAVALTAQEKMATCKFGADDQKLAGAKRKNFMNKCMAEADAPARPAKKKTN